MRLILFFLILLAIGAYVQSERVVDDQIIVALIGTA
jgi:hypothetical protein